MANGQKVYEVGVRWPVFREVTTGKILRLPVRAADIKSLLLAPFDLAKLGIRTVLDDSEPYLLDKGTKQQTNLNWRGGTPVMRLEVLQLTGEDMAICNIDEQSGSIRGSVPVENTPGGASSSSGFHRQARQ